MQTMITHADRTRICASLEWLSPSSRRGPGFGLLLARLRDASTVGPGDIPADRVTMNSRVRLRYHATGEVRDLRLVYPTAALESVDGVSVISPVGAALLGSRMGDTIEWLAPGGRQRGEVLEVLYQPEACGHPD